MWKLLILLGGIVGATAYAAPPDTTLATIRRTSIIEPLQQASQQERRELLCMALAIYHEARGEDLGGQLAVGHVILNRIDQSRKSICETVWQRGQFQWTRHAIGRQMPHELTAWRDVQYTALVLLKVKPIDTTDGATLFFNCKLAHPKWHGIVTVQFGDHVFVRPRPMASLYAADHAS